MHGLTHPYSRDRYELDDDQPGRVKVTRRDGVTVGFFAPDGHWLDGDRFEADPHLCGWLSAPRKVHRAATPSST